VSLNITSLPSGDSYFRVAFQKDDGSYFGYVMDNSGGWTPIQSLSGDCTGYYKLSDTSVTSLTLKFKIGDNATINNGTYKLKAHRFTSTCKTYYEATNNTSYTITTSMPTPTSTTNPSPTTSATPSTTPASSSFTISNVQANINSNQSFTVNISLVLPSNPDTSYYLKGAFKKSDGTRYFGLTKKDSNWIGYGEDYPGQNKIATNSNGSWSGTLEVKPDIYDSDYKGTGAYIFKVGRYTQGGSLTWSNETNITITGPQPVTVTPSPTTTSKIQTASTSSVLGTDSDSAASSDYSDQTSVSALNASLGISTSSATATAEAFEKLNERKSSPNFLLIGSGVIIITGVVGWHLRRIRNRVKL